MDKLTATLAGDAQLTGALSEICALSVDIISIDRLEASLNTEYACITGMLSGCGTLCGELSTVKTISDYVGTYEFTPTAFTQTIPISDKRATADIVINPIPQNYGLITWNGSVITVS